MRQYQPCTNTRLVRTWGWIWVFYWRLFLYGLLEWFLQYLSIKEGSLFCFVSFMPHFWSFGKLSMNKRTPTWFATFWSFRVEAIDYWNIFSMKNGNIKLYWNLGLSWCYWKLYNELDLIEFISQFSEPRCERYWFLSEFCSKNSNKLQKMGLEGKTNWPFNVFGLLNSEIFNSESVKTK